MYAKSLGAFAALLLMSEVAYGFCHEPTAPWSKPTKPTVPYCVNEWNNTHTCSDWEIDSYNDAVRRYSREVESYLDDLQTYLDDAVTYAECEIADL